MNNIILTSYLTQRDDPQSKWDPRPARWPQNSDGVVRAWIESVRRLNLNAVIFHDGLSEEFTGRWESDCVTFIGPVQWKTVWTPLEERVVIYRDFLTEWQFDYILTADLFDVEFHSDPFDVINDPTQLYIGSEPTLIGHSIVGDWMRATYGQAYYADRPTLNCGIVGGHSDLLVGFLSRWLDEMSQAVKPIVLPFDMASFNRLIYREKIPYVTGHPLHTRFRQNEGPESGAAIRHK
jgi:hypothetical protein